MFPPRTRHGQDVPTFRLKVFQPCILDRELASCPRAKCGDCYTLFDVEGRVRKSRILSVPGGDEPRARPQDLYSTSEDEGDCSRAGRERAEAMAAGFVGHRHRSGSGLLKRSGSITDLASEALSQPSEREFAQQAVARRDEHQWRRAGLDEVVLRNRSNQEIRAALFRSDDYCSLFPVVGRITQRGDSIAPFTERRFDLTDLAAREFTLKLYSVGPAARELTYLTVAPGNAYTFRDSLIS